MHYIKDPAATTDPGKANSSTGSRTESLRLDTPQRCIHGCEWFTMKKHPFTFNDPDRRWPCNAPPATNRTLNTRKREGNLNEGWRAASGKPVASRRERGGRGDLYPALPPTFPSRCWDRTPPCHCTPRWSLNKTGGRAELVRKEKRR